MKIFSPVIFVILISLAYQNGVHARVSENFRTSVNIDSQQLTPPEFPGGKAALEKYVYGNLTWPKRNNADIAASMIVTFFVEKDGSLDGFKIEKSLTPQFDAAAIRLLSASPKWKPAMKDNKPIKSHYILPIRYHINTESSMGRDSALKQ